MHAGGSRAQALSQLIFVPIAQCATEEDTRQLEQNIIDTLHPPLNQPYVSYWLV